jgi:CBS domain-containing protein
MARDVVGVEPDATLREVVQLLIERRFTGVPVVARGRVRGVISATDVLDSLATATLPTRSGAGALEPGEDESWVEEEDPAAFFTDPWPAASEDELERFEELEEGHDRLDEWTAGDVMTRALHMIPADTPLREAARYMLDAGIHRVLVEEKGELAGVVTTTDFVRAVADGRFAEQAPAAARPAAGDRAKRGAARRGR